MTDRINALTVLLDRDYRDDDVEALVQAIRQLRGVVDVRTIIVTSDATTAAWRERIECSKRLSALAGELLRSDV